MKRIPALTVCLLLACALPANATTYIVTSLADSSGTCAIDCTLRQAIAAANASEGADIIVLNVTGTLTLTQPLPPIRDGVAISGPGADQLTIRPAATHQFPIFEMGTPLSTPGPIAFSGMTMSHGTAAIVNAYVVFCVPNNPDVECPRGWPVTISRSILSDSSDAAVFNWGALTISESTLTRNGSSSSVGGALHNEFSTVRIVNSTVSGNRAGTGGGIYNSEGDLTIFNSTIVRNTAVGEGGGIFSAVSVSNRALRLRSTIAALNLSGDSPDDLSADVADSQGYNIFGAGFAGAATGDQNAVTEFDLNLGPLQCNGGPTLTHARLPGSVAIDRGLAATDVTTDQRGSARPFDDPAVPNTSGGDGSDVGAFERQAGDGHGSTTSLQTPDVTQYSDLVTLRATITVDGSPATSGAVEFFVDGESGGSVDVDSTGSAVLDVKLLKLPGSYSVKAVYSSGLVDVANSQDADTLLVWFEDATVAADPGNPSILLASGGTISGHAGRFCFLITEVPDGSPGDTSLITKLLFDVQATGSGTWQSARLTGPTFTGGGAEPRNACFEVELFGASGTLAVGLFLYPAEYYTVPIQRFPLRIADPATVRSDLLVGIGLDKTTVKPGDLLTYTITVRNFGPDTAVNPVVNDTLSSGSTFVSASPNRGRYTAPAFGQSGTVTWYPGDLANGGSESAQITVTVIVKGPTTITNTATVSLDNADPNPANNTATIATNVDKAGGGGKKK